MATHKTACCFAYLKGASKSVQIPLICIVAATVLTSENSEIASPVPLRHFLGEWWGSTTSRGVEVEATKNTTNNSRTHHGQASWHSVLWFRALKVAGKDRHDIFAFS